MTIYLRPFTLIRRRLNERFTEWLLAWQIFLLGWFAFALPETFSHPVLQSLTDLMSPVRWAFMMIFIGTFRLIFLTVNGIWAELSAPMRMIGAMAGLIVYSLFFGKFFVASQNGTISLGLLAYATFIVIDIKNFAVSTKDTFVAWQG